MQNVSGERVARDSDAARTRYEQLRAVVVGGDPSGWRHGLGVLATRGMVAWITAWAAGLGADAHGSPGATSQADSSLPTTTAWSLPTPDHEGDPELACVSFPPAVTTQIVRVLTQMTLPHTQLRAQQQEVVPP
jgi:hypothetical protein